MAELFLVRIGLQSEYQLIEIDLVPVELRAVHAPELGFAAHGDPASAAHARAVDHDRIEADHGRNVEFLGQERHELHHRHGANGHHLIDPALLQELFEHFGHETLAAMAAVIGADVQLVGGQSHLVFENEQILVAGPDDGGDMAAGLLHAPGDGVQHRHSGPSAHTDHVLAAFDVRRLAQGADDVLVGVPDLQARKSSVLLPTTM